VSHKIDAGLVINGVVQPNTPHILRDSRAWFDPVADAADAPPRKTWPITQACYHWTGGHHHVGADAALRVVRSMKARLRPDGSEMSVSCAFVISWDGMIFQVADLAVRAIHAGTVVNRCSVGVETCWSGYESQAKRLGIEGYQAQRRDVGGESVVCVRPSEALLSSCVVLAETLASLPATSGVQIPRAVPSSTKRYTGPQAARHRGALEHCHSPRATGGPIKRDAAGFVVDALAGRGWARA
jgi:hypothetical protein